MRGRASRPSIASRRSDYENQEMQGFKTLFKTPVCNPCKAWMPFGKKASI